MTCFINVFYNNCAGIVKVIPSDISLSNDDLHEAGTKWFCLFKIFFNCFFYGQLFTVKKHFNIEHKIKFYDYKTTCVLNDDNLADYVKQFSCSAGWTLGAIDDEIIEESASGSFILNRVKSNLI